MKRSTFLLRLRRLAFLAMACGLGSCVPKGPSLGAGMPTLTADGRYEDTPDNRRYWLQTYKQLIEAELRHPEEHEKWEETWRRVFPQIEKNMVNPAWVKAAIRTMRRDAKLPVWKFMY